MRPHRSRPAISDSALSPSEARAEAVRNMVDRGFVVTGANERGDSVYLAPKDVRFVIRISNHARTPKQRRLHGEVLTSLVIDRPMSRAQIDERMSAVLRDFAAICRQRGG